MCTLVSVPFHTGKLPLTGGRGWLVGSTEQHYLWFPGLRIKISVKRLHRNRFTAPDSSVSGRFCSLFWNGEGYEWAHNKVIFSSQSLIITTDRLLTFNLERVIFLMLCCLFFFLFPCSIKQLLYKAMISEEKKVMTLKGTLQNCFTPTEFRKHFCPRRSEQRCRLMQFVLKLLSIQNSSLTRRKGFTLLSLFVLYAQ